MENTIILNSGQKIEVLFQDEVSLDIDCSLRYIKSGQKEIQDYVDNVSKKELDTTIANTLLLMEAQINKGITDAQKAAAEAANQTISEKIENATTNIDNYVFTTIMPEINNNVDTTSINADKALNAASSASESAQNAAVYAESINIGKIVHTFGNEKIDGIKTFSSLPIIPTADASSNDTSAASTAFVNNKLSMAVATGSLMPFAGATPPTGWLKCDGSAISRTTYKGLFDVIGTTYGTGNGSTTFNIPNFVNRTFWGGTGTGKNLSQTLPNIKGAFKAYGYSTGGVSGVFTASKETEKVLGTGSQDNRNHILFNFSASNSSAVYQDNAVVRPNVVQTLICIKY